MAAEEVKGIERMLGGRKRQKREVKETRVDRWLSLPRNNIFFSSYFEINASNHNGAYLLHKKCP